MRWMDAYPHRLRCVGPNCDVARSYRTLRVSPLAGSFSVCAPKVERSSTIDPLRPSLQMSLLRGDSATFFVLRPRVFGP